jgi:hypothetical protein
MRDVYVPVRVSNTYGFTSLPFFALTACFALIGLMSLMRPGRSGALVTTIVSFSFLLIYFIQGKFFNYQLYPALFFGWLAIFLAAAALLKDRPSGTNVFVAMLTIACAPIVLMSFVSFNDRRPPLAENLEWMEQLNRPTAMAISKDISTSFPLAQKAGAKWVDKMHGQWVVRYSWLAKDAKHLNETQKQIILQYADQELERTLQTIYEKQPMLLIQDITDDRLIEELLKRDPAFLDDYYIASENNHTRVLARR